MVEDCGSRSYRGIVRAVYITRPDQVFIPGVLQVPEETVLTDPTGIHLGAGPYMLFYSRHMSEEQLREPLVWPTVFSVSGPLCLATASPSHSLLRRRWRRTTRGFWP